MYQVDGGGDCSCRQAKQDLAVKCNDETRFLCEKKSAY